MPCMCWYQPSDSTKKKVKDLCIELVKELRDANEIGDPIGLRTDDIHKLIDHLYYGNCDEKPNE